MTFFCPYKNSYLQTNRFIAEINPRLINRAVNKAMGWPTDCHDKELPFNRLTSNQPCLPTQRSDFLCRPLAFGRWAVPKLIRELHSDCPEIVSSAVNSLMDVVRDPEKTFEAIKFKIVDRISDLMLHKDSTIRERVLIILGTIAGQEMGKNAICNCELVLMNLLKLLTDKETVVRIKAVTLTQILADSWIATDTLIRYDFIETIHSLLATEECAAVLLLLLATFKHLIVGEGKNIAFSIGAFDTLTQLITSSTKKDKLEEALSCLAIILTLKTAKKKAVKTRLLQNCLTELLMDYRSEVHTGAAECIMHATHRTKAKKQSTEIPGLLDRLVLLSYDRSNPRLQMYAIRALTNLVEHPINRAYILQCHSERIDKIPFEISSSMPHENLAEFKKKLIEVMTWKP